jgi:hypothetical protein
MQEDGSFERYGGHSLWQEDRSIRHKVLPFKSSVHCDMTDTKSKSESRREVRLGQQELSQELNVMQSEFKTKSKKEIRTGK